MHGTARLDLEGEAEEVNALLNDLRQNGLGELYEFFGVGATDEVLSEPDNPSDDADAGSDPTNPDDTENPIPAPVITKFKYWMNSLQVPGPVSPDSLAFDLNMNGIKDNRLGQLFMSLNSSEIMLNLQSFQDEAYSSAKIIYLITLKTTDPNLMTDDAAEITIFAGNIPEGQSNLSINQAVPPATIKGHLTPGHFTSDNLFNLNIPPTSFNLQLSFAHSGILVSFPIQAVRLECDLTPSGISNAKLGGAVKSVDFHESVIPQLAIAFTSEMNWNPFSITGQSLKIMFDTGGCVNPNGKFSAANDMVIDPCEIEKNDWLKSATAPDIVLYDSNGIYAPEQINGIPDSISFGVGFTANQAEFQTD